MCTTGGDKYYHIGSRGKNGKWRLDTVKAKSYKEAVAKTAKGRNITMHEQITKTEVVQSKYKFNKNGVSRGVSW